MKICINRKSVEGPWGGGNLFVRAFCEAMKSYGHEVVHDLCDDLDIIFMQDPRYDELRLSANEIKSYKTKTPSVVVFHRVNECDARKGTSGVDEMLQSCSTFTDHTIFVSNWMKEYHLSKSWHCKNNHVLYNGVNLEHFKPREKINNSKINIVTHHWSNNRLKGFDIYEKLDEYVGKNNDMYTFTYIGRELGTFKNTKVIPPLFGEGLGEELGKYNVYISASRFDPGPNHIIESLACGLPTLCHAHGGGAVEFCGGINVFSNFEELVNSLENKSYQLNDTTKLSSWKKCMSNLNKMMVNSVKK
jgi:glycosyltransferase involved in cell wall biosynthesis